MLPGKTRVCKYNSCFGNTDKCLHGGSGFIEEMTCTEKRNKNDKTVKEYWHPDCYEAYQVDLEKRQGELADWDALLRVIADVHSIENVPNNFIYLLQDLRNGTVRLSKDRVVKRYKEGVPYGIIWEAYEMARKEIAYAKSSKNFTSVFSEIFYGYKIMLDKINTIARKKKREEKAKQLAATETKNMNSIILHDDNPYGETTVRVTTKIKKTVDISRFLD